MIKEITAKTESCHGSFKVPMIEILCEDFRYVDSGLGHHGIQMNQHLKPNEREMLTICSEIADRLQLLAKIINQ